MKNGIILIFFIAINFQGNCQNLFLEECFVGGVTVAGRTSLTFIDGYFKIKWEPDYQLKSAYVVTYRYGRPTDKTFQVNESEFLWDFSSQVGQEQISDLSSKYFAVNAQEITSKINILNDSIYVMMSGIDNSPNEPAKGWYSLDFVFLYTAPSISDTTCLRIYSASEKQYIPQHYLFEKPSYKENTDVGFSIYSDRTGIFDDRTCTNINSQSLGCTWSADATNPFAGGVRGHFYYEHSTLYGLDDDIANTQFLKSDGIAVINSYFTNEIVQNIVFSPVNYQNPQYGHNPLPAFFIVYTPDGCALPTTEMPRTYSSCRHQSTPRGQPDLPATTQFQALPGYDHYDWTPGTAFNDSTIANPICTADSSGWYRVRMWSDDPDGLCEQTIPVFYTVGQVPRPGKLSRTASTCPANTGKIVFSEMKGKAPFHYTVNGNTQSSGAFQNLAPGTYAVSVVDDLGCTWDSTVVIPLNPLQEAAFTANPEAGYSPLQVALTNQSTNSTSYQWLIDGENFSNSENTSYTFPDSGLFEIALVAYRIDPSCADTAYVTIRVAQGLEVIVPNIITPNGDKMNDALVAKIAGVESIHWEVFNRWGNSLFSGDALKPESSVTLWSPEAGEYPAGVYSVVLSLKGMSGEVRKMAVEVMVK